MWYETLLSRGLIPEPLLRYGIRRKLKSQVQSDPSGQEESAYLNRIYNSLNRSPIAVHADTANEQHYELPSEFFKIILGPRLKYSCCFFEDTSTTLEEAEVLMLSKTVSRAGVEDGDIVLDLGCGWGSLSLYIAEHYPNCLITAVSNSSSQRKYIQNQAEQYGYSNIDVITGNIANIELEKTFDRIISIEMFEHMRNYKKLLSKLANWLSVDGTLFVHMFARRGSPYLFEEDGNFMETNFFTGGTMLNVDDLPLFARDHFTLVEDWDITGNQYQKTLETWLQRMKDHKSQLIPILRKTYGDKYRKWWEYWKIFFIVCSELFGYNDGDQWIVKHYQFRRLSS